MRIPSRQITVIILTGLRPNRRAFRSGRCGRPVQLGSLAGTQLTAGRRTLAENRSFSFTRQLGKESAESQGKWLPQPGNALRAARIRRRCHSECHSPPRPRQKPREMPRISREIDLAGRQGVSAPQSECR
jgi:hypothetical protein